MLSPLLVLVALAFAPFASAHGYITSHKTRMPGPASQALCGADFNAHWNGSRNGNDISGPIFPFVNPHREIALPVDCRWYLCRGMTYDDNAHNVYTLPANSPVHIEIFILAAHSGTANLSVVDVNRNEVIPGSQLRYWGKGYASHTSHQEPPYPPSDQVDFVEDMPDLGGRCQRPGECVLQWWWWGKDSARDQYFESCIDFVQPPSSQAVEGFGGDQVVMDASGAGGGQHH